MKKIKLIRDHGGSKKGDIIELPENKAYFLLTNSIAVVSDCGSDCDECEDCKGKTKKAPVKKTVKKPRASTKK